MLNNLKFLAVARQVNVRPCFLVFAPSSFVFSASRHLSPRGRQAPVRQLIKCSLSGHSYQQQVGCHNPSVGIPVGQNKQIELHAKSIAKECFPSPRGTIKSWPLRSRSFYATHLSSAEAVCSTEIAVKRTRKSAGKSHFHALCPQFIVVPGTPQTGENVCSVRKLSLD